MSMVERKQSPDTPAEPRRRSRVVQSVAVGTVGLFLFSTAFNIALAGTKGGEIPGVRPECQPDGEGFFEPYDPTDPLDCRNFRGFKPDYGGDGDTGAGTATGVAIGVGAAIGVAALAGAFGGGLAGLLPFGGSDGCPESALQPNGDARILEALPASCTEVSRMCLAPEKTRIGAGECRVFDLRAKCKEDGKWYSVTGRAEASINIRDTQIADGCLVKLEGAKNTFCVPVTAPQTCNGRSIVVSGSFAPAGQRPMIAEARVLVRIPGDAERTTTAERHEKPETRK